MGTCYDIVNDGENNYTQTGNPDIKVAYGYVFLPVNAFWGIPNGSNVGDSSFK